MHGKPPPMPARGKIGTCTGLARSRLGLVVKRNIDALHGGMRHMRAQSAALVGALVRSSANVTGCASPVRPASQ